MAKCRIVGRGWVNISQDKAKKILEWKDNGNMDQNRMVELNYTETAELGDIRQVIFDDPAAIQQGVKSEQRERERQGEILEWNAYVNRCRHQSVEEKAWRMVNTWGKLLWTARHNKPAMHLPKKLEDELMLVFIDFFDKNKIANEKDPNVNIEWHCEQKYYNHLIPFGKVVVVSNVDGFKSLGQAMQAKLV